jgi:hypothetical protein
MPATTLRFGDDDPRYEDLKAIARVENRSVHAEILTAIDEQIARRRKDPEFKRRLERIHAEDSEIFKRLAS